MAESITHQFEVTKLIAAGVPVGKAVWNQFDEFGLVLSLPRLRGETNADYRARLVTVMAQRGNAAYTGMVLGASRGLGLPLFTPLTISPLLRTGGHTVAPDPCVEIKYGFMRLYSDYGNDVVDLEIDLWERGDNAEFYGSLQSFINTSIFFEATVDSAYVMTRSITLMNQMSRQLYTQTVERSTRWKMDREFISPNSVIFRDDKDTYALEVPQLGMVSTPGSYHIDYSRGVVTSYSIPTRNSGVEYSWSEYQWTPFASEVVISAVHDEDFRRKMFEQVRLDDGTTVSRLPTYFGVDIINELLAVAPMYWGS